MVKKNFVTKEEMGESWTEMVSAAERLQGLVDRPYKYSYNYPQKLDNKYHLKN